MLDLRDAFLQFPLAEQDQEKLAFSWNGQQFVSTRAVFGLRHMSQHFQRVMQGLLGHIPGVKVFVDNIGSDPLCRQHRLMLRPSLSTTSASPADVVDKRLDGRDIAEQALHDTLEVLRHVTQAEDSASRDKLLSIPGEGELLLILFSEGELEERRAGGMSRTELETKVWLNTQRCPAHE